MPNIVAVDFYAKGDLFRVVDRLNRVDVPDTVLATAGPLTLRGDVRSISRL